MILHTCYECEFTITELFRLHYHSQSVVKIFFPIEFFVLQPLHLNTSL